MMMTGGLPVASSQVKGRPARSRVFIVGEVVGRDLAAVRGDALPVPRRRLVVGERRERSAAGERELGDLADLRHTRELAQPALELADEGPPVGGLRVAARRHRELEGEHVAASNPGRTCCSAMKLRTSSPAPTSSTTDSATSPRMSRLRTRARAAACPRVRPPAACACGSFRDAPAAPAPARTSASSPGR